MTKPFNTPKRKEIERVMKLIFETLKINDIDNEPAMNACLNIAVNIILDQGVDEQKVRKLLEEFQSKLQEFIFEGK